MFAEELDLITAIWDKKKRMNPMFLSVYFSYEMKWDAKVMVWAINEDKLFAYSIGMYVHITCTIFFSPGAQVLVKSVGKWKI